ncbi:MAG: hypothetical protein PWP16_1509 [Eubacteriaceae bacterium]|jgi:hypothetical protein|nr:hypothetical protein [Eubacteriaceae bacterium]MDK2904345.1 hypothetical protein [Eubacteriaceae bacterium]MDK2935123.1 hypothetical protein [Eubacteriaceae bacterium]MDN5308146.1 hypothetical protein [Eubacteriaceae bacterium]
MCRQTPHQPIEFRSLLRYRTVAILGMAKYQLFCATVRPDADKRKANCRCSGVQINFVFSKSGDYPSLITNLSELLGLLGGNNPLDKGFL